MSFRALFAATVFMAIACCLSVEQAPAQITRPGPLRDHVTWVDVRTLGAVGDGVADDTAAIQRAFTLAPLGGVVFLPAGNYRVTDEILVSRAVSLRGTGRGSQLHQANPARNLLRFQAVQGVTVADLYLGSIAGTPGTSLIKLVNTHRSRFDNLILLGGHYGVHLQGALLNTFVDLRSGVNIGGFFGATAQNQYWVFGERFGAISSNANTFIAPCLEGGVNGIRIEDTNGEGSLTVVGGTIEGLAGVALHLRGTGLPTNVTGTHLELNSLGDILLENASRVRIQSVLATRRIEITGVSLNNSVSDSLVEQVVIGASARRTRLTGLSLNLSGTASPDVSDAATDTQYFSVTDINPYDWFGTVGIGRRNPSSNPMGLTPNVRLDVNGLVRAQGYATGDIHFYKGDKLVQRMFEDEAGLYVENATTGEVSRVFLERDLVPVRERIDSQQRIIDDLSRQLQVLREAVGAAR